MPYQFPRTKYAGENTIIDQIKHVLSEADEIQEVVHWLPIDKDWLAEELADLIHSAETALRILQEQHGIPYDLVKAAVIQKNRERGYYSDDPQ